METTAKFLAAAIALSLISLVANIVGVAIPYWAYASQIDATAVRGLWHRCDIRDDVESIYCFGAYDTGLFNTFRCPIRSFIEKHKLLKYLSSVDQANVIEAFNSTSRYLDDLLNIDNPYFEEIVNQIYPSELQLNKANTSDTEAPFLDLHLSISNGFVSSKIYDKRDFDIVNFPFLDGDVPRRPSYGVYLSQLTRFARVCYHIDDFNTRNKCLTTKLHKQGYRYHML